MTNKIEKGEELGKAECPSLDGEALKLKLDGNGSGERVLDDASVVGTEELGLNVVSAAGARDEATSVGRIVSTTVVESGSVSSDGKSNTKFPSRGLGSLRLRDERGPVGKLEGGGRGGRGGRVREGLGGFVAVGVGYID
jgi:hypothetical protein